MFEEIPSTDREVDSDDDIVFWYTAEAVQLIPNYIKEKNELKDRKDTVENKLVEQVTTIMSAKEDKNASRVQIKKAKTAGQNNINEQQSSRPNHSSTTSNNEKNDNINTTTENIVFDTRHVQR